MTSSGEGTLGDREAHLIRNVQQSTARNSGVRNGRVKRGGKQAERREDLETKWQP